MINHSSSFLIRKATPLDKQLLADIGGSTFYHTFRPYNTEDDMVAYINKAYHADSIAENLNNDLVAYYLAFDGSEAVGYIKLLHHASYGVVQEQAIELEKIYVLHTYFGSGLAQLLMNKAIEHGKQHTFKTLFLGVWQENHRAVSFYKKNGFEVFDTRQFKLGNNLCDDYLMKLAL